MELPTLPATRFNGRHRIILRVAKKLALAVLLGRLGQVGAVKEAALEELHCYDSEDEIEEHVHDQDVKHVFE